MNDLDFFTPGARLALELECLLMDTRNDAVQSRWWDSAHEALEQWRQAVRAMEAADAEQRPADDEVVFIDGVGAGRSSIKSCRDGVQWIMVGDRVYWPLSDADAKRLQSACCGNGHFDGPSTHVGKGEQSMTDRYRKKPVEVRAWKISLDGQEPDWVREAFDGGRIDWCPAGEGLYINTLEGRMKAGIGDMLIEGVKGELYGCRADIFAATYEPVETALATPQPEQKEDDAQETYPQMMPAELSQFLSDVMTAAGLVSHGKQCKALGERLGDALAEPTCKQPLQVAEQRGPEHISSPECWCEPELDYKDPETGAEVWVHRELQ